LRDTVYNRMGLYALSGGESSEMSALLASESEQARFAVEYFARQVRAAIGAYAAKAGGLDALVFTGGIGEHAPEIRSLICEPLGFLGFRLEEEANRTHAAVLSAADSRPVLIVPADEEAEIARLVSRLLAPAH
jgi:acetate kinase